MYFNKNDQNLLSVITSGSTLSTLLDLIFVITSLNHQAGSCGFLMIHIFNSMHVASVDGEEEWLRQI